MKRVPRHPLAWQLLSLSNRFKQPLVVLNSVITAFTNSSFKGLVPSGTACVCNICRLNWLKILLILSSVMYDSVMYDHTHCSLTLPKQDNIVPEQTKKVVMG